MSGVPEMIFVEAVVVAEMSGNESKIYKNLFYQYMCLCTGECFEKKLHLNNFKLRNISNIKYVSRGQKIRWRYTTAHHLHLCLFATDMLSVPPGCAQDKTM